MGYWTRATPAMMCSPTALIGRPRSRPTSEPAVTRAGFTDAVGETTRCLRRNSERTTPRAGYALVSSMSHAREAVEAEKVGLDGVGDGGLAAEARRGMKWSRPQYSKRSSGRKEKGSREDDKSIENRTQPELVPNQASKSNIVRGSLMHINTGAPPAHSYANSAPESESQDGGR
jgi:hypothetical protein